MPTLDLPLDIYQEIKRILQPHIEEAEVWAFGSRISGQAHANSDLDLVIRNPNHPEKPHENFLLLKQALRDSHIPIIVEVLDWARIPKSFREEIQHHYMIF